MKLAVRPEFGQRADTAAALVLRQMLDVIESNLKGSINGSDPEVLHDFRVAVRRTRSVQRQLKAVFPRDDLHHFRAELRWLQRATGDARDLDVYVLEFEDSRAMVPQALRHELDPLLAALYERLMDTRRQMVAALRSKRTKTLLREWRSFVDAMADGQLDGMPKAERPIGELVGKRIRKVYRRMLKMGDSIDATSPPEAYHELRKTGKELRYLLELFADPLYPSGVVKPMVSSLKALQDVLGRHQDREVQVQMLRSLPGQVSGRPGGSAALMAMGVLIDRMLRDEQAAREQFADRFASFASPSRTKLVKRTFG